MSAWVYILASRYRGTLYTGVTVNPARRVWEHRHAEGSAFTSRYQVLRLVHIEEHARWDEARAREALVKRWRREWKFNLIEAANPEWLDLYEQLNG